MRRYSRLESTEEKRNFRSAAILLVSSVIFIILLIFFGIPLAGRVASFVSGLKGDFSPISSNDNTPPAPPNFNFLADYTNNQILDLSGTAEPGSTVNLTFNGSTKETVTDKDGNFSYQNLSLSDGENKFSAVTKDPAGNLSHKTTEKIIILDTKPPELTLESPPDGAKFYGSTQRQIDIKGATESSANVSINERVASVDTTGKFQYPITLNNGDNSILIKVVDSAGNTTESSITVSFSE